MVGGGVIGSWHAVELCRAGYSVQHLEAGPAPLGASVRNFGLVWVSGRRSGDELDVAKRARRRWEELAHDVAGLGFRANGSLTIARSQGERKVMEEFAHHPDAADRGIALLEPADVRRLNPAIRGECEGALYCSEDAVVEPRQVLSALREHLMARSAYAFHPGRRVVALEDHGVRDATGAKWDADVVVVATGAAFDELPGCEALASQLRRVRLQMLETAPFEGALTTSVADADTLRYYPAYEVVSRDALGEQNPVAQEHHLQLLLVQRQHGGLTLGDTHAYEEPFDFALAEEPTVELLERARSILGCELPPVRRRWEGVYAQCTDGAVCARAEVRPGVWMVTGPGGRGMTCSPAIASDTVRDIGSAA